MMATMEKKIFIKVDSMEKQESVKSARKKFHDLQHDGKDKENLVGRPKIDKDAKLFPMERVEAKVRVINREMQTAAFSITAEDLKSDETSENYWRILAEKRGEVLIESFKEIEHLKEEIEHLKEDNKTCREMLHESKVLVEILQEMINETNEESGAES